MVGCSDGKRKREAEACLETVAGNDGGSGGRRLKGWSRGRERAEARRLVSQASARSCGDCGVCSPSPSWSIRMGDGAKVWMMGPVKQEGRKGKGGNSGLELGAEKREEMCKWMMELTEKNMREMYESTWGWDEKKKLRELRSPQARFMIITNDKGGGGGAGDAQPVAFLHYRFVEDARRPVLYVYEIQVVDGAQGKGYGNVLMRGAEEVAADNNMEKVVLTCFTTNRKALAFYSKVGYTVDETCPSLCDGSDDEACFTVLSKVVKEKRTPVKGIECESVTPALEVADSTRDSMRQLER